MEENQQMQALDRLLKTWANNICDTTKDIISSAMSGRSPETMTSFQSQHQIFDDIRDRQSRVISTIQEAHNRQLELLKSAISEERREFSRAQLVFEQSLRTKYEHSIEALRETIQSELDSRMIRTLKNLEHQAKLEGDRAKQAHDFEYEVESRLTTRLKTMIADLRKSWEEEEISRIKQTEEKLRNNYNIVLEHMEAQLRMALQLQEDADEKWLEELDHRNKKQLESIRLFEEKCRRLYETRLIDYAEKTSAQIASYEDKLLEVGSVLAAEKNQFESRLRRIKLACSRWKIAYQAEIHNRYREMTGALEERYSSEVNTLLQEIQSLKVQVADCQKTIDMKEKEILKTHEMFNAGRAANAMATVQLRHDLNHKWDELKVPVNERVEVLSNLLDSAQATPELLTLYETLTTKLSARIPISQLLNRKQFIEYKLKLASRAAAEGGPGALPASEKADLIAELTEVKSNLDKLSKQYEKNFGETIAVPIASTLSSNYVPTNQQQQPGAGMVANMMAANLQQGQMQQQQQQMLYQQQQQLQQQMAMQQQQQAQMQQQAQQQSQLQSQLQAQQQQLQQQQQQAQPEVPTTPMTRMQSNANNVTPMNRANANSNNHISIPEPAASSANENTNDNAPPPRQLSRVQSMKLALAGNKDSTAATKESSPIPSESTSSKSNSDVNIPKLNRVNSNFKNSLSSLFNNRGGDAGADANPPKKNFLDS